MNNERKEYISHLKKYISYLKKNLKHRFRKEGSEMINDLGLILEPSVMQRSNNEEVENAIECVSSFYGSDKTCQIVHGYLVEGVTEEEETFDKLLDQDKLKQEWPSLREMINGSYKGLSTEDV